jgi:hypothetical protein
MCRAANRIRHKEASMAKGQIRSNREKKKPKQDKTKVKVSASPFASANSNPARAAKSK